MITVDEKLKILALCRKYRVARAILFGSSAEKHGRVPRDIDIAVEGVAPDRFFALYGELMFSLSKPIDLVDLGKKSKFTSIILADGEDLHVTPERAS